MHASVTCAVAFTLFSLPALAPAPALAQVSGVDHADRLAGELALKRAQVRADKCAAGKATTTEQTRSPVEQFFVGPLRGSYPTTGTAGPVRCDK